MKRKIVESGPDPTDNLLRLQRFFEEVNATHICKKCAICSSVIQKPVVDIKNAILNDVDVLIISETASEEDIEYHIPFIGVTGMYFRKALYEAGVSKYSVVLTNAVVCRAKDVSNMNRIPTLLELNNCSDRIKVFIETLRPKKICLVGTVAAKFYTKKLSEGGIKLPIHIIHHPAYVIRMGNKDFYKIWVKNIRKVFRSK